MSDKYSIPFLHIPSIFLLRINPEWVKGDVYHNAVTTRNTELSARDKTLVKDLYGPPKGLGSVAMGTTEAGLGKQLSEEHISAIAKEISDWRRMSQCMGFTEGEQTAIDGNGQGEEERRYSMLTYTHCKLHDC